MKTKRLTLCALLTAGALALSLLESAIPLGLFVPLPGIKLGLSNVVTLFALFCLGGPQALAILLCRIFLMYWMTGSVTGLLMSLSGGLLALGAMWLARRGYPRFFSVYGVSMAGAVCHGIGQILCAMALMRSAMIGYYLPFLLISGLVSGALTGAAAQGAIRARGLWERKGRT